MFPHPSVHSVALVFGSKKDTPLTRQNVRRMFTGCTAKLLGVCSFTKYTQALHSNKSSMSHQIQILFGFTQVHSFSLCLVKSLLHVNKKLGRHTRHWNTQLRHTNQLLVIAQTVFLPFFCIKSVNTKKCHSFNPAYSLSTHFAFLEGLNKELLFTQAH